LLWAIDPDALVRRQRGIVTAQTACWRFGCAVAVEYDENQLRAERGIVVSYETVRRWVNHFGPMIAADLRKRRPKPHSVWHLDEVYLKIGGRMVYLWRAVDAEGEVLDVETGMLR
jgi:putative transposase